MRPRHSLNSGARPLSADVRYTVKLGRKIVILLLAAASRTVSAGPDNCNIPAYAELTQLSPRQAAALAAAMKDFGACERRISRLISSGQSSWIRAATSMLQYSDAGVSESIVDSLGYAMLAAPSRLLPVADSIPQHKLEDFCVPLFLGEVPEGRERALRTLARAEAMYKDFLSSRWRNEAQRCLASIQQIREYYVFAPN